MTYFVVLKCFDQIIFYCHTVRFYANFFLPSKFATLICLSSSMVGGLTSASCTLSLGKPASGISNYCCDNSVALLDNKLFKSTSKLLLNSEFCMQIIHSFPDMCDNRFDIPFFSQMCRLVFLPLPDLLQTN